MRRLLILLAIALVAAVPCTPASPPLGEWRYGNLSVMPGPGASIKRDGSAIVVEDFAGDRAFTSTTSRYDAGTLALLSASMHASCCANEWSADVTRGADGSYDVVARHLAPGGDNMKETTQRAHVPASSRPVVVNATSLLPWMYHVTHAGSIDDVSLPSGTRDSIDVQTLDVAEAKDEAVPQGFPSDERALRIGPESRQPTVLWYDPCTFVVDGFEVSGRLVVRNDLDASR